MSYREKIKIFEATSHNKDDVLEEVDEFIKSNIDDNFYDSHDIETTSALVSYDETTKKPVFAYSFCVKYKHRA